MKRPDSNF